MKTHLAIIVGMVSLSTLAPAGLQKVALAGGVPLIQTCATVFGVGDCTGLAGADWMPASCGRAYLFKDLWGKAKLPLGPKRAGVGYMGPVCWSGPPPQPATLVPTTPGWQPNLDPQSKKNTDWEAVKDIGPCCFCCTVVTDF